MNIHLIACGVLKRDIIRLQKELNIHLNSTFLPGGLHETPHKLKAELQAAIDRASMSSPAPDKIVIGYGVCGNGTVGLRAHDTALVFPRVHDCIALFLGGNSRYRTEFAKSPGTYYVSEGWHAEKSPSENDNHKTVWMGDRKVHLDQLVHEYGEETAQHTFQFLNSWQSNYERAVFIDINQADESSAEHYARHLADRHGWRFERIRGSDSLLKKLLLSDKTDDDILVVKPGFTTYFDTSQNRLAAGSGTPRSSGSIYAPSHMSEKGAHTPPPPITFGLGIDAGGTYTDAVIYQFKDKSVQEKSKALTTRWDYAVGIRNALSKLNQESLKKVQFVTISTTLATNALIEEEGQPAGLILMFNPEMVDITNLGCNPKAVVPGRMDISGRVLEPVNPERVRQIVRNMIEHHHVQAFAVSGFAGAINPQHELEVKRIITEETGCFVCCGHELSQKLDFKVRAETAFWNARIIPLVVVLLEKVRQVLNEFSIDARIMVVKGDGTLMSPELAVQRPVETLLSGPAASINGALFLSEIDHAVVVDMGGTSTDIAVIEDRRASFSEKGATVGARHTHVRTLDILSGGIGGDSLISVDNQTISVGPSRVAPVAWAETEYPEMDKAVECFMEIIINQHRSTGFHQFLLANPKMPPHDLHLTDIERLMLGFIQKRPRSMDELTKLTDILHPGLLPIQRLVQSGLIQRCGITPTDLLHMKGALDIWSCKLSRHVCGIVSGIVGMSLDKFIDAALEKVCLQLAVLILEKQPGFEGLRMELPLSRICRTLADCLSGDRGRLNHVRIQLNLPLIGVGAPARYFIPRAATLLGTESILPENGDVANAIGAIVTQVEISRHALIKSSEQGGYYIEGIAGHIHATDISEAERFATDALTVQVRELARLAGASQPLLQYSATDRTISTSLGHELFLERRIEVRYSGMPDCLLLEPAAAELCGADC